MDEETARIEDLYQHGSEQLLSDSSLRDALDDDQAQQLLDWGMAQLRASAEKAREFPAAQAEIVIADTVQSLRRVMQQANRLVERAPQGAEDIYVAVLRFVEGLNELDEHTIRLEDLMILEQLALQRDNLERSTVFSRLMAVINGEEEE